MPHFAARSKSVFMLPKADENNNVGNDVHEKIQNTHLRYLNGMDQDRMALHFIAPAPGRPPYALVRGKDADETVEIAQSIGLSEFHVDRAKNRIHCQGHYLAYIPIAEWKTRQAERQQWAREARQSFHENVREKLDSVKGAKGVTMQVGEFMERQAHAERDGQPFVAVSAWNVADD